MKEKRPQPGQDLKVVPVTEPDGTEALFLRLEQAVLNVLLHYEGQYEETLSDWFLALKLIEPDMLSVRQLIRVFDRLSEAGLVQFTRGDDPYTPGDQTFFLGKPFTVVLRAEGIVQPSTLKI